MQTGIGHELARGASSREPSWRLLVAEVVEDYGVAVALALRRGGSDGWLPVLQPVDSRLRPLPLAGDSVHDRLAGEPGLDAAEWTAFQRLWYRWLAPLDHLPAMRWYLTAAWPAAERPPAALSERVDTCLQELELTPPAERPRRLAETLGRGDPARPVLGWGDPLWALPAMLHACLTGRQFVWFDERDELLAAVAGGDGTPLIAVPSHQLDLDLVNSLQDAHGFSIDLPRVRDVRFQGRPVGFFTARTLETLTRMVVKHEAYRHQPVERSAWVFTAEVAGRETDPDVTLLGSDQAGAAYLELLEAPELLVLAGHSREDLFHLGDDAICGRSRDADERPPEHDRLPACALDGRCIKGGAILPVHELSARALVANGCNLMRLGGRSSFAPEYTIAFTALEGPCNLVVASRRTRFGEEIGHVLLYQLLRAGTPAAEAVRLVNNSLPFSCAEPPDNLVLGDGDWRLFPELEGPGARVELERAPGGWRLRAADVDTPVLRVRLPELPAEVHVRPATPEGCGPDLHHAVAPEPDGSATLLLFGWRRLVAERLDLWIGTEPLAGDSLAALRRAQRNLAYGRLLRSYLPRFENQERELQSSGVHVARLLREARHRVRAAEEAVGRAAEAGELLGRMDAAICGALLERIGTSAFVWLDQYMEADGRFDVAEHLPSGARCPYCDSPVVRRVYRHLLLAEVAREFEICQTCGNIADLPLGGPRARFRGPDVLPRGARVPQEVVVCNSSRHRVRGQVGFRVYQADRFGTRVTPAQAPVELDAGEEQAVAFEIEVGERIPAHMEFMRGFWVGALDVSVFQKNIWVRPA
ncbi:MAG TPA: hypothetical protein VLW53_16285 [Candidatus Eisenbacteria bacterium]|nr:hypothetical protein [Candidatus Eisenbacteria bacterium]